MSSGDEIKENRSRLHTNNDKNPANLLTMECLLKQVFEVHKKTVRELKIKLRVLTSELQEALVSNSSCPNCEKERQRLEELTQRYEKQLHEKDQLILKLINRQKTSNSEIESQHNSSISSHHKTKKRKVILNKSESSGYSNTLEKSSISDGTLLKEGILQEQVFSDNEGNGGSSSSKAEIQLVPETVLDTLDYNPLSPCNIIVPETVGLDVEISETVPFFPTNDTTSGCNEEKKLSSISKCSAKCLTKSSDTIIAECKYTSSNTENSLDCCEIFPSANCQKCHEPEMNRSFEEFETKWCNKKNDCNSASVTANNGTKNSRKTKRCDRNTTSSKYVISFERLPKNYRKPKYKQMTLTQNFFELPDENIDGISGSLAKSQEEEVTSNSDSSNKTRSDEHINENISNYTNCKEVQNNINLVNLDSVSDEESNLDCTYVPPHLIAATCQKQPGDISFAKSIKNVDLREPDGDQLVDDLSSGSEDLLQEMLKQSPVKNRGKSDLIVSNCLLNKPSNKNVQQHEKLLTDFDIVPEKNAEPNYKFMNDVVRSKDERRKLDGHECFECEAYFSALKLDTDEKKKRLKECSRHRGKYSAPKTPEHFWSVDFPSRHECKDKGDVISVQHRPLRKRRLKI